MKTSFKHRQGEEARKGCSSRRWEDRRAKREERREQREERGEEREDKIKGTNEKREEMEKREFKREEKREERLEKACKMKEMRPLRLQNEGLRLPKPPQEAFVTPKGPPRAL